MKFYFIEIRSRHVNGCRFISKCHVIYALEDDTIKKGYPSDEVQEAMKDMDGEREDYKDNLEQLKDFVEAQKNDMEDLKSQVLSYQVTKNL